MADAFRQLDDDLVVYRHKNITYQAPLFALGNRLYVRYQRGFVRLFQGGGCALPDVFIEQIISARNIHADVHGRLFVEEKGNE